MFLFYFSFSLNPMINFQHLLVLSSRSLCCFLCWLSRPSVCLIPLIYHHFRESFHFPPMLDTLTHLLFLPSCMCVCVYLSLFGVCAVHMHKPPLRSLERVALLYWQASESLWSAFLCWFKSACSFPPWAGV